jgi:hypothetical protein
MEPPLMALIKVEVDGEVQRMSDSFFRGSKPQFHPEDRTLERDYAVDRFLMHGWAPRAPFMDRETPVVAFGSCFAKNISNYLHGRGYNVLTKKDNKAYVTSMGDGMVHTHAIRQQFEWAWEDKRPQADLWIGYDAEEFGYDEQTRLETRALFDAAGVFIITLGLSEIWYDEVTGEVFWRQPPDGRRDPERHKFRVATHEETVDNLRAIHALIRTHRPDAAIVFTVSPIPLRATFRNVACLSANAVSKAILRAAVDQVHRELSAGDDRLFYFPSYNVVMHAFDNQWTPDRRHVYPHVLRFNMVMFEKYYCIDGVGDEELAAAYRKARTLDRAVAREGHEAVARRPANAPKRAPGRAADAESVRQARIEARIETRIRDRMAARAAARAAGNDAEQGGG